MDPNATLSAMLSAYGRAEYEEAREHARDLIGWLDHHGFPPAGHTAASARQLAREIKTQSAYALAETTLYHSEPIDNWTQVR